MPIQFNRGSGIVRITGGINERGPDAVVIDLSVVKGVSVDLDIETKNFLYLTFLLEKRKGRVVEWTTCIPNNARQLKLVEDISNYCYKREPARCACDCWAKKISGLRFFRKKPFVKGDEQ